MHCWNIRTIKALALVALACEVRAQNISDSPYSAYGFGDLVNSAQISQSVMGSVGVAVMDPFSVTSVNPATYTTLGTPAFEVGGSWHSAQLATTTQEAARSGIQLAGLSLGVPFGGRKWGVALGMQPYTNVGYFVTQKAATSDGTPVTIEYQGSGGINRAYLGLGRVLFHQRDSAWQESRRKDTLSLGRKLSFGANFNYLFGSLESTNKVAYPASSGFYSTKFRSSMVLRDPSYTVGLLYSGQLVKWRREHDRLLRSGRSKRARFDAKNQLLADSLRKEYDVVKRDTMAWGYHIGLFSEFGADLGARYNELLSTYVVRGGVETDVDSITGVTGGRGSVVLPPLFGVGLTLTHGAALTFTAEYRQRDWTQLSANVEGWSLPGELGVQRTYAAGLAWRPAGNSYDEGRFLRNIVYRLGARYADDYLIVRGTQLNEMAVSGGLSIPLLGLFSRSRLTIGGEYGQRGTLDNGLIQERFTNVFVGITFTPDPREAWFVKRKID